MEFKASNGVTVESETQAITGYRRIKFHTENQGEMFELSGEYMKALIEALDHERDEELGRWRDPKNLNHVAYRQGNEVSVVDEVHGTWGQWDRASASSDRGRDSLASTAHAYFEAHPERKPWDDAEVGDLWALTKAGRGTDVWRRGMHEWRIVTPGTTGSVSPASVLEADSGHRIWPESD